MPTAPCFAKLGTESVEHRSKDQHRDRGKKSRSREILDPWSEYCVVPTVLTSYSLHLQNGAALHSLTPACSAANLPTIGSLNSFC